MDADFIGRIYESAAVPDLWSGQGVMEQLARRAGCDKGVIMAAPPTSDIRWRCNDASVEGMHIYFRENWIKRNPYLATRERIQKFNEPRFIMDREVMSIEEMEASEYYRGFMRPQGFYWHAGTSILSPTGDVIKISVHRDYDAGPLPDDTIEGLSVIRPHLARAALLAARVRFEQVRSAVNLLDALGLPACAMLKGRMVLANSSLQALVPSVIIDRHESIAFASKAANSRWRALCETGVGQFGGSLAIEATETTPAMVGHFLPVAGVAKDIFGVADLILVLVSSKNESVVESSVLIALYDLTHAEAEIAKSVAQGKKVEEIAQMRAVSVGTIRAQLHSIFEKTGTTRQSELSRLMLGLTGMVGRRS